MAVVGGASWLILLAGVLRGFFRLSIFDLLFLLAPWVMAPLGLNLVAAQADRLAQMNVLVVRYLLFPAAALATASFFLKDGRAAGALVCPWLIVASAVALDGLERFIRTRLQSFPEFCFALGEGYAFVGALWLAASRTGMQLFGFREPIVLLTAIHFHYAGLMAAILAGLAASSMRTPLALRTALSCAVAGPGLLGLAFLIGPKLKLAAVCLLVIGECGIAFATFRVGLGKARGIGGRLLLLGSVCVIFGMALAGMCGLWANTRSMPLSISNKWRAIMGFSIRSALVCARSWAGACCNVRVCRNANEIAGSVAMGRTCRPPGLRHRGACRRGHQTQSRPADCILVPGL